jgi:hypothetical protein
MRIRSTGLWPGINPGRFLSYVRYFEWDWAIGKSLREPELTRLRHSARYWAFMLFGI